MGVSGVPFVDGLAHHDPTPGKKLFSWSAQSGIIRAFQRLSKILVPLMSHASIGQCPVNQEPDGFLDFIHHLSEPVECYGPAN